MYPKQWRVSAPKPSGKPFMPRTKSLPEPSWIGKARHINGMYDAIPKYRAV